MSTPPPPGKIYSYTTANYELKTCIGTNKLKNLCWHAHFNKTKGYCPTCRSAHSKDIMEMLGWIGGSAFPSLFSGLYTANTTIKLETINCNSKRITNFHVLMMITIKWFHVNISITTKINEATTKTLLPHGTEVHRIEVTSQRKIVRKFYVIFCVLYPDYPVLFNQIIYNKSLNTPIYHKI